MPKYINAERVHGKCSFCRNRETCPEKRGSHWHCWHFDEKFAADVAELKRGEWIIKETARQKITYTRKQIAHCPYCGHMEDRKISKFCSECGADMRGKLE